MTNIPPETLKRMFARQVAFSMEAIESMSLGSNPASPDQIKRQVKSYFWGLYEEITGDTRSNRPQ